MVSDALKVTTSLSRPFIVAGTPFTITTTITNAHDEKVEILGYEYLIPYQVQWIKDSDYNEAYNRSQQQNRFVRFFSRSPWREAAQPPGTTMTYSSTKGPDEAIQTILPGETEGYSFKALVPKWIFTTGAEITFEGRIRYRYKDEKHTSQFRVSFVLRPPLSANIIGAICGGILGTTARFLRDLGVSSSVGFDLSFLSASALAVILGVIMVVFSSRRTGAFQPILTIEDLWGGMLAGFLVGYLGHDFFGEVVTIAK